MVDFVPSEKGTTFRQPSTANLMLDSEDRSATFVSPWDFQITRSQSILNGFFTRIGVTEHVLEWTIPNITTKNDTLNITWNPTAGPAQTANITLNTGFYTVATLLDAIVAGANTAFTTAVFEVGTSNGLATIQVNDGSDFSINSGSLLPALGITDDTTVAAPGFEIVNPDLRPYRYLDFVSAQLTYNQDLKDGTTNNFNRDVLARWYFVWDTPPTLDALGYPILMGYTPFFVRRVFNPPKQIRWDARQPVGNLAFQVYTDQGGLLVAPADALPDSSNWLMTLQVSEV